MRPTSLALHKIHFLSSLIPISTILFFNSALKEFTAVYVKRSDPEKNPKRYPEQKRGKEPLTEERRIYRSLV